MKKILLLLMMIASVASAQPKMSDAKIKAIISDGVWTCNVGRKSLSISYRPDGSEGEDGEGMKWDIKGGVLTEIDPAERIPGVPAAQVHNYAILFLTKHELLLQDTKDKSSYAFMYR